MRPLPRAGWRSPGQCQSWPRSRGRPFPANLSWFPPACLDCGVAALLGLARRCDITAAGAEVIYRAALCQPPRGTCLGTCRVKVALGSAKEVLEVLPELEGRRAAPEPVTDVHLVNHKFWREYECVRHGRVMMRVGVLLDFVCALHLEVHIGHIGPVGTGRDPHLEGLVQVIWENGHELREGHGAPLMEHDHLALVLPLARAMLASAQH